MSDYRKAVVAVKRGLPISVNTLIDAWLDLLACAPDEDEIDYLLSNTLFRKQLSEDDLICVIRRFSDNYHSERSNAYLDLLMLQQLQRGDFEWTEKAYKTLLNCGENAVKHFLSDKFDGRVYMYHLISREIIFGFQNESGYTDEEAVKRLLKITNEKSPVNLGDVAYAIYRSIQCFEKSKENIFDILWKEYRNAALAGIRIAAKSDVDYLKNMVPIFNKYPDMLKHCIFDTVMLARNSAYNNCFDSKTLSELDAAGCMSLRKYLMNFGLKES